MGGIEKELLGCFKVCIILTLVLRDDPFLVFSRVKSQYDVEICENKCQGKQWEEKKEISGFLKDRNVSILKKNYIAMWSFVHLCRSHQW
jgi:hypothetical protein